MKRIIIYLSLCVMVIGGSRLESAVVEVQKPIILSLGKARNMRVAIFNNVKEFNKFCSNNPNIEIKDVKVNGNYGTLVLIYVVPYDNYVEITNKK